MLSEMNEENINRIYAELLNSVDCGVLAYTVPQYEVFNINKEARNIFELENEDTIQAFTKFYNDMIHPEDRTRILKDNSNLEQNGGEVTHKYRIIGKKGVKYVKSVSKMIVSENGQKYILVSVTDTTRLVQLKKLLNRERASCREALIKNCEYGFFFDLTEGIVDEEFVTENELGLAEMLGIEPPVKFDELAFTYLQKVNPVFLEKGMEKYFTVKGLKDAYEKGMSCVNTEYYIALTDKYIRTNAIISKDDENDHLQAYIIAYDISEMRKKEREVNRQLVTQNMQLLSITDELTEQLATGILAYTLPERNILVFNQEAKNMFGVPELKTGVLNFDVTHRIVPEDKKAVSLAVKKLQKPGDSVEYTFHNLNKDGTIAALKCRTRLLSFSDGGLYILSSIADITEQENFEKRLCEERQNYKTALAIGSFAFFNIDLTEGKIKEPIIAKNGENLTEEFGVQLPVYYDDFARIMFGENRIQTDSDKIEALRSRKRLISAYKDGTSVIDLDYYVSDKKMSIHLMLMLYRIDNNLNATFIFYDKNN